MKFSFTTPALLATFAIGLAVGSALSLPANAEGIVLHSAHGFSGAMASRESARPVISNANVDITNQNRKWHTVIKTQDHMELGFQFDEDQRIFHKTETVSFDPMTDVPTHRSYVVWSNDIRPGYEFDRDARVFTKLIELDNAQARQMGLR